ncbi:hypothetical protein Nepgr_023443 [Nepenthes gracilis]|uniref:Uncharacterized protein n=1 Tax=Nepenthes gracilis TaxID=150966 RepID=A0AAD3XZF1_NEPGR|nr:hypothetical protein Nepgr_023443 [Nepenthes gracilis]
MRTTDGQGVWVCLRQILSVKTLTDQGAQQAHGRAKARERPRSKWVHRQPGCKWKSMEALVPFARQSLTGKKRQIKCLDLPVGQNDKSA